MFSAGRASAKKISPARLRKAPPPFIYSDSIRWFTEWSFLLRRESLSVGSRLPCRKRMWTGTSCVPVLLPSLHSASTGGNRGNRGTLSPFPLFPLFPPVKRKRQYWRPVGSVSVGFLKEFKQEETEITERAFFLRFLCFLLLKFRLRHRRP